jgi:AraC family transcriptional regulator
MAIVLDRGEFFGNVVAFAQWEPFRISETRYARGAFLPWHRHEESYLTFVLAGGYRERSSGRTRACGARTLVLHPAGDTHEDDFAERPTRCLNVVLDASFTSRLGDAADPLHRGDVVDTPEASAISARLAAEVRRADSASGMIVEGLLLELFGVLSRRGAEDGDAPPWLAEAHSIVQRRCCEKLALADVAAAVGVHPVHLARAFRSRYGVSVGERIRELRLQSAREQLDQGVGLATVAVQAGFTDQSHFTKAFTRAHGVGPGEYRRRTRAAR